MLKIDITDATYGDYYRIAQYAWEGSPQHGDLPPQTFVRDLTLALEAYARGALD
jgi:hypothetical protein